jgi:hypothetical protein
LTDPQVTWSAVVGPAMIASAEGRIREAVAIWRAGMPDNPTVSVGWRWDTARHSIRLGDAESAAADLAELDTRASQTIRL